MIHALPSLRSAAWVTSLLGLLLLACAADVTEPVVDFDEPQWLSVSAGREHTCAMTAEARLACWGANDRGQLGAGDSVERADAAFVQSAVRFLAVSSGGRHTCAIDETQALWCWGANDMGQLGDGTLRDRRRPVLMGVQGPFTHVSAGAEHTCAVRGVAEGLCWGANHAGQIGNGVDFTGALPPTPISGELDFTSVSSGGTHSCGVANGGSGYCWGGNQTGSLGNGTLIDASVPVNVTGQNLFRILRVGDTHSCGVDPQARAWCWGNNQFGQVTSRTGLVQGSPTLRSDDSIRDIGVGEHWTCALLVRAGVRCWGVRWDQTDSDGSHSVSQNGWSPEIDSGGAPVALSVGTRHACIVTETMRIFCWGE